MVRQTSFIAFIFLRLFLVLLNKAEGKSIGGHYSSQRTLGSNSPGGHGSSSGSQLQNSMYWGHSRLPSDINPCFDYGMEITL